MPVDLDQFVLPRLLQVEIALDPEAVEDRLRQARGHVVEHRLRRKQRRQRSALIAGLGGQGDAREELRARVAHIGGRGRKLRLGAADVGTLCQQLGRKPGRHARQRDLPQASATDVHALRRPRHQHGKRIHVLRKRLPQERQGRLLVGQRALLLRQIEIGRGADVQSLLEGIVDALGAGDVVVGDANAILRGKHLEIGIGDADQRRQRDHVAVEAAGDCGLVRGERRVAVLAPEVDLVARAKRHGEGVDGASARARCSCSTLRATSATATPRRCRRWRETAARRPGARARRPGGSARLRLRCRD